MRKILRLLPGVLVFILAAAAHAVAVPLPTKDASLNLVVTIQPQFQLNENGAPNGSDASYDLFVRRTRLAATGDVGNNWSYYFQVDNANFGKFGNFTGRMIVQDAWIAFGPFGTKGNNVLLIDNTTVFDDQAVDFLLGGVGGPNNQDWFWAGPQDMFALEPGEKNK